MWADMNRIALIRTHVETWIRSQHTLGHIQWLVVSQHGGGKAAALHLGELVDQHVTRGHDLAFKFQAPAEEKRLAESATVGEFWEVKFNAFNASQ